MATATKVTRVANPRRRKNRRVRWNPKMIRNRSGQFVKKARKVKRRVRRTANTKRYTPIKRRKASKRTYRRKPNPILIELGAINPFRGTQKRRKPMAKAKKQRRRPNAQRVYRRRRPNPKAVARPRKRRIQHRVYRRRRPNPKAHHVVRRRRYVAAYKRRQNRRKNPEIFGRSGGKDLLMMVGGGLVGVAATKFLPTLIPSSITASLGASPIVGVGMTIAGAFAASWLAKKVSPSFGDAVLFGGLMQAGSVLLTAFAPASLSSQLALSGMGDIVPGMFVVPQNPVTNRPMLAAPMASSGGGGMGAAIPRPFGRR